MPTNENCRIKFNADGDIVKFESITITPREPMLTAKYYHSLCRLLNRSIFSVGGYDYAKSIDDAERYNVLENTWSKLPNLLRPVNEPATCLYKDKYLYAICGYDSIMSSYLDLV